jgi:hypothetical protein
MPESLADYKRFVDASLEQISNKLKQKISSLGLSKKDLADRELNYKLYFDNVTALIFKSTTSEEVLKLKSKNEKKLEMLSPNDKQSAIEYTNDQVKQLMNDDIHEHALAHLDDKRFENHLQEIVKNPPRPSSHHRSYDQVVKGDCTIIKIKNNNNYSHKIIFHKIGKFLMYQVYDPKGIVPITHLPVHPNITNHPTEYNEALKHIEENPEKTVTIKHEINKDRDVNLKNGKEWVSYFNSKPDFTPTTVMEIGYDRYVFVIKKTKIDKNDKVVFYISTKEIRVDNKLKKMIQIPTGNKYKNVRFDIDAVGDQSADCQGGLIKGTSRCYCPNGSIVTTMGVNWIDLCMDTCEDGYNNTAGVCWGSKYYGCGDGCTNVAGCCWDGWTACTNPNCAGYKVSSYIPSSFIWVNSNGYYCNDDGRNYSQGGITSPTGDCPKIKDSVGLDNGAECWLASSSSKYCCVEEGNTYCCPPGSSCTPPPPKPVINIGMTGDLVLNYSIDLANYVDDSISYEINNIILVDEDIPDTMRSKYVFLEGSILRILFGVQGSCTLTVIQDGSVKPLKISINFYNLSLYFIPDNIRNGVINISITGILAENYSIDLANYVVGDKALDISYELTNIKIVDNKGEYIPEDKITGYVFLDVSRATGVASILRILFKAQGSCTLTVRQNNLKNNLKNKIKLQFK